MNKEMHYWRQFSVSSFVVGLSCWPLNQAIAQTIIPDNTLPINSAVIEAGNTLTIEEGTIAGQNLFHSFQEFSLPRQKTALFNHNSNITNIFSRVTSGEISHIDGLIKTNGSANLFLINPNGLIFGENAALDVGGAFIGSTASEIDFGNNNYYSAINPQHPALLTITAPIGLGFSAKPGNIVNQSRNGLAVSPGQTLRLIGGNIDLNGGSLITEGGFIEIGSIKFGQWSLIDPRTSTQELSNYGDIRLNKGAVIDTSSTGAGSIEIRGRNLTLTEASQITADTLGNKDGIGIHIEVEQLKVENGSLISASTFSSGAGGNITLNARESLEMVGNGFNALEQIIISTFAGTITLPDIDFGILTGTNGSGRAGNIAIETKNLILREGSIISTRTFGEGRGRRRWKYLPRVWTPPTSLVETQTKYPTN